MNVIEFLEYRMEKTAMVGANASMPMAGSNPMMGNNMGMVPSAQKPIMPSYAKGGVVKYKKGGRIVRVAEKGDEAIIPLSKKKADKKNARKVAKKILEKTAFLKKAKPPSKLKKALSYGLPVTALAAADLGHTMMWHKAGYNKGLAESRKKALEKKAYIGMSDVLAGHDTYKRYKNLSEKDKSVSSRIKNMITGGPSYKESLMTGGKKGAILGAKGTIPGTVYDVVLGSAAGTGNKYVGKTTGSYIKGAPKSALGGAAEAVGSRAGRTVGQAARYGAINAGLDALRTKRIKAQAKKDRRLAAILAGGAGLSTLAAKNLSK